MTALLRHKHSATCILAMLCLTPLLLVNSEMWDACYAEMAFLRQDFSLIEKWATKFGWYLSYYGYLVLNEISGVTSIPYKVFTNVITVISILGLAREVYWYIENRFGLEKEYALLGALVTISFPVWHTLVSTACFINIVCLWMFMASVRLSYTNKPLALLLFIPSVQLFSVFSLAVGLVFSEFLLTVTRKTFVKQSVRTFLFSLALLIGFIGLTSVINVNGTKGNYNTINAEHIEYLLMLLVYCAATVAIGVGLMTRIKDAGEKEQFLRHILVIAALILFAVLPYVAVGRPMRFFAFGSFTARHTYLTCIPFALMMAVIFRYVARQVNEKAALYGSCFILVALVVLLHQGYSHKVAAVIFKEMITDSFAATEAPPSGYVAIKVEGAKPPRHVHNYAINLCLYKAYGKSAWMANGYWRRSMKLNPESLRKLYGDTKGAPMCEDVTGDAYTKYTFSLDGYSQEGRFWYWYYHLASNYSAFSPKLKLVESIPGTS